MPRSDIIIQEYDFTTCRSLYKCICTHEWGPVQAGFGLLCKPWFCNVVVQQKKARQPVHLTEASHWGADDFTHLVEALSLYRLCVKFTTFLRKMFTVLTSCCTFPPHHYTHKDYGSSFAVWARAKPLKTNYKKVDIKLIKGLWVSS